MLKLSWVELKLGVINTHDNDMSELNINQYLFYEIRNRIHCNS